MKIFAPFTPEEVEQLKNWQEGPYHPFTCGTPEECPHKAQEADNSLIPSTEGWKCPCGKYTQDWCHNYMAGYGDESCQECGRGEMKQVGFTQPSGRMNFECDNCGATASFP